MAGTFSHLASRGAFIDNPFKNLSHGAIALLILVSVICFFACFLVRLFEILPAAAKKKKMSVGILKLI
jgi:hypothetical protein